MNIFLESLHVLKENWVEFYTPPSNPLLSMQKMRSRKLWLL